MRTRWGDELRIARLRRRESQADTGKAIGSTGPTVSRAERGLQGSLDVYHRLASHLGVSLELGDAS